MPVVHSLGISTDSSTANASAKLIDVRCLGKSTSSQQADDSVAVFCTACDDRRHEGCLCGHRASRHHKFREGLRIHASLQSEVHGTFERPAQGNWPLGAGNDQGLLQEICELWPLV